MTCQNCLYWLQAKDPAQPNLQLGGLCKRYPPKATTLPGLPVGTPLWPITAPGEWCGEHLPRGRVAEETQEDMQGRKPAAETLGMELPEGL